MMDFLIADDDAARAREAHQAWQQAVDQPAVGGGIAAAAIEMGQSRAGAKLGHGLGQGVAEIAEKHMVARGDAIGMGGDLAVEDEDRPGATDFAQMVKGAAIAKAEFQYRSGQIAQQCDGCIEAGALGLQTADETVETTHGYMTFCQTW